MDENLHFPLVLQQKRQISLDTISMSSEPLFGPFGTIVVQLAPSPAAIACSDLVFVFGPSGSKGIFIKLGSQAQGADLGIQLGPTGQIIFLRAQKRSASYAP